ncbi:MAG: hypothetical protein JSU94_00885, partial [Phycisphaerales bacterium]
MKIHRFLHRRPLAGSAAILLGIALLAWGIMPKIRPTTPRQNPQVFTCEDANIVEFTESILRDRLNYSVRLSDTAQTLTNTGSFGVVEGYPIAKTLMLASHRWKVKFYLKPDRVFVCLPHEEPPPAFCSNDTKLIYAEPLPIVNNLKFSYDKHMCGPNCLALLAYALGKPVSVDQVAALAGTSPSAGTTMSGLARAAERLGLNATGLQMSLDTYKKLKSPVIIHLDVGGG